MFSILNLSGSTSITKHTATQTLTYLLTSLCYGLMWMMLLNWCTHTEREREEERICNRVLYSRFSILWLQCQEHRIKNVKIRNNPISIGENGNATHLWFSSHLILLSVFITYAFYFRLLTVNSFTLNRKKK